MFSTDTGLESGVCGARVVPWLDLSDRTRSAFGSPFLIVRHGGTDAGGLIRFGDRLLDLVRAVERASRLRRGVQRLCDLDDRMTG